MDRVEGTKIDNSKAWVSAPSHLHTKGVPRQPTNHQGKHNTNYHHPNKEVKVEVSHNFSHSNSSNSEDSYSTYQSRRREATWNQTTTHIPSTMVAAHKSAKGILPSHTRTHSPVASPGYSTTMASLIATTE